MTAAVKPGMQLLGKYTFLAVIGEGGMSVVYKARHPDLNKILAVKMLHSHLLGGEEAAGRFWQEARAASALSHKNVITVHDYGATPEGQQFMVMDYLAGTDLSKTIKANGPLPLEQALDVFIQICDGLQHAHNKGVVHRDLKPSNIVLTIDDDGRIVPKLVDFGIAKVLVDSDEQSHAYTKTGELLGSPPYMSPEQCKGSKLDARSDLYSLGCLMYEALTGQPPFSGSNFMETIFKHVNDPPPSLKSANANIAYPAKLESILQKCLAKPRVDRYQTAAELRTDLQKLQATITGDSSALGPSVTKKGLLIGGTVFGALLIAGGIFVGAKLNNPPADKPVPSAVAVSSAFKEDLTSSQGSESPTDEVLAEAIAVTPDKTEWDLMAGCSDAALKYIARLKHLESLNLSHERSISDNALKYLAASEAPLHNLNVNNTNITSYGLKYITKFPIQKLEVQNEAAIDDNAGKYIAQLPGLENLQIAINPGFGDLGLSQLLGLKNLAEVDFEKTGITDRAMQIFGKLPSLRVLDVCSTAVTAAGLPYIAGLTKLEELDLKDCKLGPGALKELPTLPMLSTLTLNGTDISDKDLRELTRFKKLEKVTLDRCPITDAGLPPLTKLADLKILSLNNTSVTRTGIERLKDCRSLTQVYVNGINLTAAEQASLSTLMPQIRFHWNTAD